MEFDAIVYTSQFGHTKRYAEMLDIGQHTIESDLDYSRLVEIFNTAKD